MKQLYFIIIFLLCPILGLPQSAEFFDRKKLSGLLVEPDSLLNAAILNYAKDKKYLDDEDIERGRYEQTEVYRIESVTGRGTEWHVYLFTVPSCLSHPDWGILIRKDDDISVYSTALELAPLVLELCDIVIEEDTACPSKLVSEAIYNILSYVNQHTEIKKECSDDDIYYYQISDWVHIFKKNETGYLVFWKKEYNKRYNPVKRLEMQPVPPHPILNEHVKSWIEVSYRAEFPYRLYNFSPASRAESIYLVETEHSYGKTYDLLFKEDGRCVFYRIDNLFIPLLYELRGRIKEEHTLLCALRMMSLSYMYYYYRDDGDD